MTVCRVAAVAPPSTRYPPACPKSCNAVDRNNCVLVASTRRVDLGGFIHASRPMRSHSHPTTVAASTLATKRATTISGRPGKATPVATSTTGLMAGEASRKASATAGFTPRSTSRPASGTAPHSQPGSSTPPSAAVGTAARGLSRASVSNAPAGTNAVTAPLRITPRTRNGTACRNTAWNTVTQLPTAARPSRSAATGRKAAAATSPTRTRVTTLGSRVARPDWGGTLGHPSCLVSAGA